MWTYNLYLYISSDIIICSFSPHSKKAINQRPYLNESIMRKFYGYGIDDDIRMAWVCPPGVGTGTGWECRSKFQSRDSDPGMRIWISIPGLNRDGTGIPAKSRNFFMFKMTSLFFVNQNYIKNKIWDLKLLSFFYHFDFRFKNRFGLSNNFDFGFKNGFGFINHFDFVGNNPFWF